jgi:glycogen debranching enzyme
MSSLISTATGCLSTGRGRRPGSSTRFLRVFEGLLDAAASFGAYRLPELFAGFSRTDYEDPVPYPVACSPQAWAAALPAMLTAGLGLVPDALNQTLRIRRPSLPRHVGRLALQGLRVGDASVDLLFERIAQRPDAVALTDVQVDGDVDVVLEVRDPVRSRELAPTHPPPSRRGG